MVSFCWFLAGFYISWTTPNEFPLTWSQGVKHTPSIYMSQEAQDGWLRGEQEALVDGFEDPFSDSWG